MRKESMSLAWKEIVCYCLKSDPRRVWGMLEDKEQKGTGYENSCFG